jgi:hypothetical protein
MITYFITQPASERPVISQAPLNDDSKLDPQQAMEQHIRKMIEIRRKGVSKYFSESTI